DGIRDFHVTGVQTCALPISVRIAEGAIDGAGQPVEFLPDEPVFRHLAARGRGDLQEGDLPPALGMALQELAEGAEALRLPLAVRSEERRVGKECRSRGSADA